MHKTIIIIILSCIGTINNTFAQHFYTKGMFFGIPTEKFGWQIDSYNIQFGFEYQHNKNAILMHYTSILNGIPDYLTNYRIGYNYYLRAKPSAYYINTAIDFEENSINGYGKSITYNSLNSTALGLNIGMGKKWMLFRNIGIELNVGILPKIKDKQISVTEYFKTATSNYAEYTYTNKLYFTLTPYANAMLIYRTNLSSK